MPRDFKAEYQRRKAAAQARGFSSPRTEQNVRRVARGLPARDYAIEREVLLRKADHIGLDSVVDYRAYMRAKAQGETAEKRWTLNYFGISETRFNKERRENKQWHNEYAMLQYTEINTYNTEIDKNVHDWSPRRVGYIDSFYRAIVSPLTNYESLPDNKGFYKKGPIPRKRMNKSQYDYLVKYGHIMSANEFEARYGMFMTK